MPGGKSMFVRKEHAGSTSTGHTWDRDGQIVEVPDEVGADLLAIPDAGFSEVARDGLPDGWDADPDAGAGDGSDEDPDAGAEAEGGDGKSDGDEKEPEEVTEPGPAATVTEPAPAAEPDKTPVAEAPAKPPRKNAPKAAKE